MILWTDRTVRDAGRMVPDDRETDTGTPLRGSLVRPRPKSLCSRPAKVQDTGHRPNQPLRDSWVLSRQNGMGSFGPRHAQRSGISNELVKSLTFLFWKGASHEGHS